MDWFRQYTFITPSISDSGAYHSITYAKLPRPFRNRLLASSVLKAMVIALIVRLFNICCPTTIVGRVRAIVVDAVDAVFGRGTRPHIGKEVLKGFAPAVADKDTSPAVSRVAGTHWIMAPVQHHAQGVVFSRLFTFSSRAVLRKPLLQLFNFETTARTCVSGYQVAGHDRYFGSAVAAAKPPRHLRSEIRSSLNHGQSPEALPGKVYKVVCFCGILGRHQKFLSGVGSQGIHGAAGSIY